KKPEKRFQSAQDLAFALRHLAGSTAAMPALGPAEANERAVGRWIAALAAGVVLVFIGVIGGRWLSAGDAVVDPIQLTRITSDRLKETDASYSPDGRAVAYLRIGSGTTDLLVKPFDTAASILLVHSTPALGSPVWFPPGNKVCYTTVRRDFMCVG